MGSHRLMKELRDNQAEVKRSGDAEIVLTLVDDDLFHWHARIKGPADSPYDGGRFTLDIRISRQYPMTPPNIHFVTRVFHPNVHPKTGEICLNILRSEWSPAWTLSTTCRAIIVLLSHPEPESPLNCDAGNLLRNSDARGFRSMARMYTTLCASDDAAAADTATAVRAAAGPSS